MQKKIVPAIIALFAATAFIVPAQAETLRIGNPQIQAFSFVPLQIGVKKGFFEKQGLQIEEIGLGGAGKQEQALISDSIDIALGAGTDLAYVAKGVPAIGVAQMAGPPLMLGVVVPYDSPAKSADDLKGKKIAVSTAGSLTEWFMLKLEQKQGWAKGTIKTVPMGGDWTGETAAMLTGQIDGFVTVSALGYKLAETKQGRTLLSTSEIVHDFIQHVIFAQNKLVEKNPDSIRRFLTGWFDTIDWMRANKEEAVQLTMLSTRFDHEVESQEFDLVMPMFSADGKFQAAGLKTVEESFMDLKILPSPPDMSKLYTEAYLPKR
jgi:ABC-type nitrate/sulfonate/bicarbonate transport system substrate-binding protein